MAVTVSTIADPLGTKLVIDVDADATAETNVTGAATTIYAVEIDNTANAVPVYLKLSNSAGSLTPGTTEPNMVIRCAALSKHTHMIGSGVVFDVGLGFWCVLSPYSLTNDDADAANPPASSVPVKILCT